MTSIYERRIVDFVLSCRVFGRKIEEAMVHTLMKQAETLQLETISAEYLPTPKNVPCLKFLEKSGFESKKNDHEFCWDMNKKYPAPQEINIVVKEESSS